jgi:three-Cys-motif partner protein
MVEMTTRICKKDSCKDKIFNCKMLGKDNLPVQCVGPWAENKYYFLERYLNASCEARRKFSDKNNAVFIDLFAGPGTCIIRGEKKEIPSGGIRALRREEARFNEYFYFDISEVNVDALKKRIGAVSNCNICCDDSNLMIKRLVDVLNRKAYRYHFAFIDPFGPDGLSFQTIKELARLKRMDLLIHFPIGAIKRTINKWIKNQDTILDKFLGTDQWRDKIKNASQNNVYQILTDIFKEQLKTVGYPEEGLKLAPSDENAFSGLPTVAVKNTKEVDLYVLILAAKNKLAQKIWNSVIKRRPDGQKSFNF